MPLINVKIIEGVFSAAQRPRSFTSSPTPWSPSKVRRSDRSRGL